MISTIAVSSGDWPEGARKLSRAQRCPPLSPPEPDRAHPSHDDPIGQIVEMWLLNTYASASGGATATIYRKLFSSLRTYLQMHGLDLNSQGNQLPQCVQSWASQRTPNSRRPGSVAPATYNQRIAAINSFYSWITRNQVAAWPNPTEALSRTTIQKYAQAHALDVQQVRLRLKSIDRSTARGKRDYALLQVALNTGRSARELAGLHWGNLDLRDEQAIMLTFEGGRGGKVIHDTLDYRLSQALLDYLHTVYGTDLQGLSPAAPIWVSFSDRTARQAIGHQTIADICATHLGVSKTQQLRHTFALAMDQVGAPVDAIQTRLGHEDRTTTDIYLANLKKARNPYAGDLADCFGLETE
jgi:site-specific recombinase XerD